MAKKKQTTKTTRTGAGLALVGGQMKTRGSTKRATSTKASEAEPTTKVEPKIAPGAIRGEDLCTFAMRIPRSESAEIHKAAGPGKASQFVRRLAVAAARGDIDAVHAIVGDVVRGK